MRGNPPSVFIIGGLMGTFCAANAEVKANTGFQGTYSDSTASTAISTPTLTEVNYFISQCESEILMTLNSLGITSVSNSYLSGTCTRYNAIGAAGMVLRRFGNADDQVKANRLLDDYKEFLNKIISDKDYQNMIARINNSNSPGALCGNEQTLGFVSSQSSGFPTYGVDRFII